MADKLGKSSKGEPMHFSSGAVIKKDGKYLLIDRAIPPLGFACVAGHIDKGETPEEGLIREVKEESGLDITDHKLIFKEEVENNTCSKGITTHFWHLYDCKVSGKIKRSIREEKSIAWYSKEEIKKLYKDKRLEPVWEYWFKKLKVI